MRALFGLLLALVVLAAGAVLWTGRQAGQLPDWYVEAREAGALEQDMVAAGQNAERSLVGRFGRELIDEVTADDGTRDESFLERISRRGKLVLEGLREGREVRLGPGDVENLILAWAARDDQGRELLAATRAVRAEIGGGELQLGVIAVPAELPAERLPAAQRRLLDRVLRIAGSEGEIHVAVRAVPGVFEEQLFLGPPLRLVVGGLELGPAALAALGVDAPELTTGITLDVGRMKVRQVSVEEDSLVLVVSPEI